VKYIDRKKPKILFEFVIFQVLFQQNRVLILVNRVQEIRMRRVKIQLPAHRVQLNNMQVCENFNRKSGV